MAAQLLQIKRLSWSLVSVNCYSWLMMSQDMFDSQWQTLSVTMLYIFAAQMHARQLLTFHWRENLIFTMPLVSSWNWFFEWLIIVIWLILSGRTGRLKQIQRSCSYVRTHDWNLNHSQYFAVTPTQVLVTNTHIPWSPQEDEGCRLSFVSSQVHYIFFAALSAYMDDNILRFRIILVPLTDTFV